MPTPPPATLPPPTLVPDGLAAVLPISLDPVDAAAVSPTVVLRPLVDPTVDATGFDPRSSYVEHFWLGILGPSSVWLLRRVALGFDTWPDGFELDVHETADALGLAAGHRNSTFTRTVQRIVQFGMARLGDDGLYVRRRLPPLSPRHLNRLPASLRDAHRAWTAGTDDLAREHERAHAAAAGLVAIGDEPELVEHHLRAMGIHPRIAAQAVAWALSRSRHPTAHTPPDAA
jgi:hypothetical protein